MKFSTDGKYIFLLNELSLSVSTFAYDEQQVRHASFDHSTLSDSMKAKESFNSSSEICDTPTGSSFMLPIVVSIE